MTGRYLFSVILLICVATAAAKDICPYTLLTKTGIQAANATSGAQVNLVFNTSDSDLHVISNISQYNVLGRHYESFQNDTLDAFFFSGPCEHYCDDILAFQGSEANSWNVELFVLRASLPTTPCNFTRWYFVNRTLHGPRDDYEFDFCNGTEAVGAKMQKLTGASLLRLVGMPSYTT